jgi:hypothetical protein
MELRQMILQVLNPQVQALFHNLTAARTPDEWVQREAFIRTEVANLATEESGSWPDSAEVAFSRHCPVCGEAMPSNDDWHSLNSAELRSPILLHLEGLKGAPPCRVTAEVLHYLNGDVRPLKFSDALVLEAKVRYSKLAAASTPALVRRGRAVARE